MEKQDQLVREFLAHRDPLFGFILALTHDREASEEIFQEVGVAILNEANKGTKVGRFMPWARELARRRVAEFYRKASHLEAAERPSEGLDAVVSQCFEENEIDPEASRLRQELLHECLEELPERARAVIEERYRGQKPIREIATRLEWKEESVRVALSRARKSLAECVEGKLGAGGGI